MKVSNNHTATRNNTQFELQYMCCRNVTTGP